MIGMDAKPNGRFCAHWSFGMTQSGRLRVQETGKADAAVVHAHDPTRTFSLSSLRPKF